jgi:hypothetical protein
MAEVCMDFPWEDFETQELIPSAKRARFAEGPELTKIKFFKFEDVCVL